METYVKLKVGETEVYRSIAPTVLPPFAALRMIDEARPLFPSQVITEIGYRDGPEEDSPTHVLSRESEQGDAYFNLKATEKPRILPL